MSESLFQAGGPLLAGSDVYVVRDADGKAQRHLQQMEYMTLVEPRQQGKTSLINRLIGQFQEQNYLFACGDLTTFEKTTEVDWYKSLCDWLLRQIKFISRKGRLSLPTNGNSWRNFLADLAEKAEKSSLNLVLVFDEVGATPGVFATDFFSVIRSIYNHRQTMPCFRHLSFIVAGAYNPKDLINDRTISNFNVDHRVPLNDFSVDELGHLVAKLVLGAPIKQISERLHYWAAGQPYISQQLCAYLSAQQSAVTVESVNKAVAQFFHEDTNHLSRIQNDLEAEPALFEYVLSTIAGKTKFTPSVNDEHFRLSHVIGIISADKKGYCQIRNRVYEQAYPRLNKKGLSGNVVTNQDTQIVSPTSDEKGNIALQQRQLAKVRENLRLIEERKTEYVESTNIPLTLIKEERRLQKCIAELERELGLQS